ncbi:MAG: hypothetical protein ACREM3_16550 [Candidatus Rokuibacteriota bacterium]
MLVESTASPRRLAGTDWPIYLRSFRTPRPAGEHRVAFQPTAQAIDQAAKPETLVSGVAFEHVPSGREQEHALVVNLGGEFHSVDEVVAERCSAGTEETLVQLAVTRVESADGDPALLDVFLIVPLTPEIVRSERLRVTFSVRHRSYTGHVTRLEHAIPDCVVSLASRGARP